MCSGQNRPQGFYLDITFVANCDSWRWDKDVSPPTQTVPQGHGSFEAPPNVLRGPRSNSDEGPSDSTLQKSGP